MVATTPAKIEAQVDKRLKVIDITIKRHNGNPEGLIEVLHKAQESFGRSGPSADILRKGAPLRKKFLSCGLAGPINAKKAQTLYVTLPRIKIAGERTCVSASPRKSRTTNTASA